MSILREPTALVLCLPGRRYKRFLGRELTHEATSKWPLPPDEVERLRTDPESILPPAETCDSGEAA